MPWGKSKCGRCVGDKAAGQRFSARVRMRIDNCRWTFDLHCPRACNFCQMASKDDIELFSQEVKICMIGSPFFYYKDLDLKINYN